MPVASFEGDTEAEGLLLANTLKSQCPSMRGILLPSKRGILLPSKRGILLPWQTFSRVKSALVHFLSEVTREY
jgi:hypothetical protein